MGRSRRTGRRVGRPPTSRSRAPCGRLPGHLLADEQRGVALARSVVGDRLLVLADDPRDLLHVTLLRRLAEDGVAVLARTTALVRPTWADRLVVVPAVQL